MSRDKKKKEKKLHAINYTGKLDITRSGMGFVAVEDLKQDILIYKENTGVALNGDTVKVEITREKSGGRMEGRITDVISRRQNEFSGRLEVKEHFAFLIPDKANMPVDIFIPKELLHDGVDGDKAMVRIIEWSPKAKNPVGEVIGILTNEPPNEIAMQGILTEAGFTLTFPDEVLEEAARFSDAIDKDEVGRRKDLRGLLTLTIDPVDAKDFDDAISIKKLDDGNLEIGVHIADVSHFVRPGTKLDEEAYSRATSVYLPDRVLPMLPEHLSNQLCSLRPDEDKYAFSAIFQMNKAGKVKSHWLGKTIIRSDRRFSYEEVQAVIEGGDDKLKEELLTLNTIAQNLRATRFKKGAINFSSQEVRFRLDENAKPVEVMIKESKEANKLVEEFMLLANRTVAEYAGSIQFKGKPLPFPYRVHDMPDEIKLQSFAAFASRFGHPFNLNDPKSVTQSFNEMLDAVRGTPEQHVLETLGIRTMAKAIYTTENIGHYGLGFDDYCHFTSPIRRYPDVLVHRIIQHCLEKDMTPIKGLDEMCRHCSDQERAAMEAERAANKYKQVEYMQAFVGDEFDAIVSGVAAFGFWAETVEHKCEGMVSMMDLSAIDDFEFVETDYAIVGRNTGLRFRMGDPVKIRVTAANLDKRQIDFELTDVPKGKLARRDRSGEVKEKTARNARQGKSKSADSKGHYGKSEKGASKKPDGKKRKK